MVDELRLLARLKKRKHSAIEQAIEIYTPYLGTVLYNMIGTQLPIEDVEEIVSDTFLALWKNAQYIDPEKGTLRSYIAAVARNLALKRLNKRQEYIPLEEINQADGTNAAEAFLTSADLWQAVMQLGEPDNEIFVRYYKYGQSQKDISKILGMNLSTVKTRLSRGKEKLRKILKNAEELL